MPVPPIHRGLPGAGLLLAGVLLSGCLWLAPQATSAPQTPAVQSGPPDAALVQLVEALRQQDVHMDPLAGALWIPIRIEVRDELLEYLLVGAAGATHESLFSTEVPGSVLNTAFLALGLQAGRNASWRPRDPKPTEEQARAGVAPYEVTLPEGQGLQLNVAWRQGDDLYCYRVEDLLRNLLTGASMQRHDWIYLGSRMLPPDPRKKGGPQTEMFAADIYQNLINISYFSEAYTILTAALPECVEQTIWLPNAWLMPQRGSRVALFFSRGRLERIPDSLISGLPLIDPALRDARKSAESGTTQGR